MRTLITAGLVAIAIALTAAPAMLQEPPPPVAPRQISVTETVAAVLAELAEPACLAGIVRNDTIFVGAIAQGWCTPQIGRAVPVCPITPEVFDAQARAREAARETVRVVVCAGRGIMFLIERPPRGPKTGSVS